MSDVTKSAYELLEFAVNNKIVFKPGVWALIAEYADKGCSLKFYTYFLILLYRYGSWNADENKRIHWGVLHRRWYMRQNY